jgi:hypothetical protein
MSNGMMYCTCNNLYKRLFDIRRDRTRDRAAREYLEDRNGHAVV